MQIRVFWCGISVTLTAWPHEDYAWTLYVTEMRYCRKSEFPQDFDSLIYEPQADDERRPEIVHWNSTSPSPQIPSHPKLQPRTVDKCNHRNIANARVDERWFIKQQEKTLKTAAYWQYLRTQLSWGVVTGRFESECECRASLCSGR